LTPCLFDDDADGFFDFFFPLDPPTPEGTAFSLFSLSELGPAPLAGAVDFSFSAPVPAGGALADVEDEAEGT
jgi:hypothetical protein